MQSVVRLSRRLDTIVIESPHISFDARPAPVTDVRRSLLQLCWNKRKTSATEIGISLETPDATVHGTSIGANPLRDSSDKAISENR